jgi:beta-fructofuranosidase
MNISRRRFLQLSTAAAISSFRPRLPADNQDLCRKLASDPLRPQFHLLPAHNWMNDPNGPIFFRSRYHMFYQYNPNAAVWGDMHWAHATSPDMIHWTHDSIALSPTPGSPDQYGVFSGSAVLDNGKPTVIYTGVQPPAQSSEATLRDGAHTWRETQCLAVAADDELRQWTKRAEPIIASPPPGMEVTGFRDPCLWRENERWMLILGSGFRNEGGAILLYSSRDLRNWTYLHPLVEGVPSGKTTSNPVDSGDMWECPDFFPLGNKHVLLISTMGKVRWKVGTYTNQRFTPEKEGLVDCGSYYAAKTMLDRDGNRVLWGWIPETRPEADLVAAGWAGVMSLPRVMSLSAGDQFQTRIAPAAAVLRDIYYRGSDTASLDRVRVENVAAEIKVRVQPRGAECKLLLQSEKRDFLTFSITNQAERRSIQVNTFSAPVMGHPHSPLDLHIFIDGSVIEIFANDAALTARSYQLPSGPLRLRLEGNADIQSLEIWHMKPISNDRLTGSLCA